MKKEIFIEGMSCGHCKMRVENVLSEIDGVKSAEVILAENKAVVEFYKEVDEDMIARLIDEAGYKVLEFTH